MPVRAYEFIIISYNIRDKRSFRSVAEKIWENCEPSNFPFIPCCARVNGTKCSESAASPLALSVACVTRS